MNLSRSIGWLFLVIPAYSWATGPVKKFPEDEIVVTATRFKQRLQDLPVGASVISATQIRNSAASTLPELLQQLAGVHTRNTDGSPDQQIDLRGFGITGNQNTLVLLNGQRLNEIELVGIRWSAIPIDSIERIEVLRSSGAVTYGDNATGGVINIVTRAAAPNRVTGDAGISMGSYSGTEFKGALNVAKENLSFALTANSLETDNYRVNNALRQGNLQGDLRYRLANGSLMLNFGVDDQKLQLPGPRTEAQLQSDRRGATTPNDFSTREGAYVMLRGEHAVGAATLAADLSFRDNSRTALFKDYSFGFFNNRLSTHSDVWLFNPRVKLPFQGLGAGHELVVGANFEWWDYRSKRFGGALADTLAADVVARIDNKAIYLQHATTLPLGTVISLGGRAQWTDNKADDQFNPAAYARDQKNRMLHAYDVGVRQPLSSAFSLYGKFGRSFRIVTVDEVYSQFGGPPPLFDSMVTLLRPQTAHTGELGMEYRQGTVHARTSIYRTDLNNEIGYMVISDATQPFPPFTNNINLPPTRRQGVEFEGSWTPFDKLDLFGSYTFNDARFREGVFGGANVAGKTVPLVPQHRASAGGTFRLTPNTRFAATMNYVGEQVYDNDQANSFGRRMPDYTTVDFKAMHQMGNLSLSLALNNLFDQKYYSYAIRNNAGTSFNAYPARERNVWLTVRYQFN